jgi:hypothetical protein
MTSPNPREQSAVISGSFADYRLVKSRSVLQVIVEIPIEQQGAAFAALGYPLPGTEIPVAVARLNSPAGNLQPQQERVFAEPDGYTVPNPKPSTPAGGSKSKGERAVIRAAILCAEPRFRIWMAGENISTNEAAVMLREACGVASRGDIAKDPAALDKFLKLETDYLLEIGAMAAPR